MPLPRLMRPKKPSPRWLRAISHAGWGLFGAAAALLGALTLFPAPPPSMPETAELAVMRAAVAVVEQTHGDLKIAVITPDETETDTTMGTAWKALAVISRDLRAVWALPAIAKGPGWGTALMDWHSGNASIMDVPGFQRRCIMLVPSSKFTGSTLLAGIGGFLVSQDALPPRSFHAFVAYHEGAHCADPFLATPSFSTKAKLRGEALADAWAAMMIARDYEGGAIVGEFMARARSSEDTQPYYRTSPAIQEALKVVRELQARGALKDTTPADLFRTAVGIAERHSGYAEGATR